MCVEVCKSCVKFSNRLSCGMTLWKWKISLFLALFSFPLWVYIKTSSFESFYMPPLDKVAQRKRSHAWHSLVRVHDATQKLHIFANGYTAYLQITLDENGIWKVAVLRHDAPQLRNAMSLGRFVENPRKHIYMCASLSIRLSYNELNEFT